VGGWITALVSILSDDAGLCFVRGELVEGIVIGFWIDALEPCPPISAITPLVTVTGRAAGTGVDLSTLASSAEANAARAAAGAEARTTAALRSEPNIGVPPETAAMAGTKAENSAASSLTNVSKPDATANANASKSLAVQTESIASAETNAANSRQLAQNFESAQPQKLHADAGTKLADLASAPKIDGSLPEGYRSLSGLSADAASGKLPEGFSKAVNRENGNIDIIDLKTKKIYKFAGEDGAGNPVYKSGQQYYTFENGKQTIPVKDVSLFDTADGLPSADSYAGRTQHLAASQGSINTASAYTRAAKGETVWDTAERPGSWLPQRQAFQDKLLDGKMLQALKQAEGGTMIEAIYAMRGGTGVGKTRLRQSGLSPELSANMPVVNPDELKMDLIRGSDVNLTHDQVHIESSVLADRYLKMLLDAKNANGGHAVPSVLVDRRLGSLQEVKALAAEAQRTGRKLNVADVDAPLEQSLLGVLMRKPGGDDPITPFSALAEGGFIPARANRSAIMGIFEENPDIGRYELYGTKPNGDKYLVAKVENGKSMIFDRQAWDILTDQRAANEYISKFRQSKIDKTEISLVTEALPDGEWKLFVIDTLHKYMGLTWEEAVSRHGQL